MVLLVAYLIVVQSVVLAVSLVITFRLAGKGLSQSLDSSAIIKDVLQSIRPVLIDPGLEQQRLTLEQQRMAVEANERNQETRERILANMYGQVTEEDDYDDGLPGDFVPAHAPNPDDPNQKTFSEMMRAIQ